MKILSISAGFFFFVLATSLTLAANISPSVGFINTTMREGTSLVDVDFRVDDPDDQTVEIAVCAFKDGIISPQNFIRVSTLLEGTGSKIGAQIGTGQVHRLTWDVGLDWGRDNGNFTVCILPRDRDSLLRVDWITIPGITVSSRPIESEQLRRVFYWFLSKGDPELSVDKESNVVWWRGYRAITDSELTLVGKTYIFKKLDLGFVYPEDRRLMSASEAGFATHPQAQTPSRSNWVRKGFRGPRMHSGYPEWSDALNDYLGDFDILYDAHYDVINWNYNTQQEDYISVPFRYFLTSDGRGIQVHQQHPFFRASGWWFGQNINVREYINYQDNKIDSYNYGEWIPIP